jgi:tetraacyldisaccharide 4'-kinase
LKRPLLLPLVPFYAAGLALREFRLTRGWEPTRRLRYPVISIGNLSTGGSGKTPLAIALARLLSAHGFHVDILSRGYGRMSREPAHVQREGTPEQYGDEPLLIAREAGVPVYVAAERYDAGKFAEMDYQISMESSSCASGHDSGNPRSGSRAEDSLEKAGALAPEPPHPIHILDDGFQHRQLSRDIDILLVNDEDWHDRLLPVGNLRESLNATRRASALAIPADDSGFEAELRNWGWAGPIWRLRRHMEIPQISGPVVAFCGIARPDQFFAGLKAAGISLASEITFADHHRYSSRDMERVSSSARSAGAAAVVTTEKDRIRLEKLISTMPSSLPLETVRLTVSIDDESQVCGWLSERLTPHTSSLPL